ncbi:hypothetical protein KAR91_02075 [Candidatus Pacearchaeota archaeon]|nr:hypothetical protein [Candidatus Pacearchaeota archaeon]
MPKKFVVCDYCQADIRRKESVEIVKNDNGSAFFLCDECYEAHHDWPVGYWTVYMYP